MARVHPEPEELFEIQCPDLTAEEELASYLPAYRHPILKLAMTLCSRLRLRRYSNRELVSIWVR